MRFTRQEESCTSAYTVHTLRGVANAAPDWTRQTYRTCSALKTSHLPPDALRRKYGYEAFRSEVFVSLPPSRLPFLSLTHSALRHQVWRVSTGSSHERCLLRLLSSFASLKLHAASRCDEKYGSSTEFLGEHAVQITTRTWLNINTHR